MEDGRLDNFLINMRRKNGFTIIELIVVIAIIAVLAGIVLVGVNQYIAKARNSKKLADILEYAKALEIYRSEKGVYPYGDSGYCCLGINPPATECAFLGVCTTINASLAPYFPALPSGTRLNSGGGSYTYTSAKDEGGGACTANECGAFQIDYVLEGGNVACGPGVKTSSDANYTYCSYPHLWYTN